MNVSMYVCMYVCMYIKWRSKNVIIESLCAGRATLSASLIFLGTQIKDSISKKNNAK